MNFIPPHNFDYEESVLAAILIDFDNLDVFDALSVGDFYKTAHQKIFTAMAQLHKAKQPVDAAPLKNKLQETGELEAIGGAAYLSNIMDIAPYPTSKNHYIQTLIDLSARRKLITMGLELVKSASDKTQTVDDVLAGTNRMLNAVETSGDTAEYVAIGDMVVPAIERYERLNQPGACSGVKTGFTLLDYAMGGLQNGDLTILAGRPGMGKSAFSMCVAMNQAKAGVPVGVFSLEMSKDQNTDRVLSGLSRVNLQKFRTGKITTGEWTDLIEAGDRAARLPIYIDDTPGLHYQQLRRRARVMHRKEGIGMLFIDYMQLMSGDKGDKRQGEVASISRNLKLLAKELNIPVVALSQMNREVENRETKRPRLSDLRESGAIEQDADNIAFLWHKSNQESPEADKGRREIYLAKQRMGPVVEIGVAWKEETAMFYNLEVWER